MFYSQIPEAVKLSEYKVENHVATAKGDLAERIMFFALEKYFSEEGDDVVIIHSHKFLNNVSNNEKDFIIINLTKGNNKDVYQVCIRNIEKPLWVFNCLGRPGRFWQEKTVPIMSNF